MINKKNCHTKEQIGGTEKTDNLCKERKIQRRTTFNTTPLHNMKNRNEEEDEKT